MNDPIYTRFAASQYRLAGSFVAVNPDLCEIHPLPEARFLVHFRCPALIRPPGGEVTVIHGCDVGVWFDPDYCRQVTLNLATILTPHIYHPNVHPVTGTACLGRIAPSTPIHDVLAQLYEMIVWREFRPGDCLNPEAAQWIRRHPDRAPLETDRPLRIPKPEDLAA